MFLGSERVAVLGFPQVRVNDGEWHHVLVELKSVKDGKDMKYMALVSLDYGLYEVLRHTHTHRDTDTNTRIRTHSKSYTLCVSVCLQRSVEIGNELPGLRLRALYLGGLPGVGNHVHDGFTGCIQVRFNSNHGLDYIILHNIKYCSPLYVYTYLS